MSTIEQNPMKSIPPSYLVIRSMDAIQMFDTQIPSPDDILEYNLGEAVVSLPSISSNLTNAGGSSLNATEQILDSAQSQALIVPICKFSGYLKDTREHDTADTQAELNDSKRVPVEGTFYGFHRGFLTKDTVRDGLIHGDMLRDVSKLYLEVEDLTNSEWIARSLDPEHLGNNRKSAQSGTKLFYPTNCENIESLTPGDVVHIEGVEVDTNLDFRLLRGKTRFGSNPQPNEQTLEGLAGIFDNNTSGLRGKSSVYLNLRTITLEKEREYEELMKKVDCERGEQLQRNGKSTQSAVTKFVSHMRESIRGFTEALNGASLTRNP